MPANFLALALRRLQYMSMVSLGNFSHGTMMSIIRRWSSSSSIAVVFRYGHLLIFHRKELTTHYVSKPSLRVEHKLLVLAQQQLAQKAHHMARRVAFQSARTPPSEDTLWPSTTMVSRSGHLAGLDGKATLPLHVQHSLLAALICRARLVRRCSSRCSSIEMALLRLLL